MPASVFVYPIIVSFLCSPVGTIDSVAKIGYFTETEPITYSGRVYIDHEDIGSQYRYNRFMVNTVSNYYSKPSDRYTNLQKYFEKMVFDRMALRLEDSGSISEITGWHPIKYHFLGGEQKKSEDKDTSSQWPSKEVRAKACKVFIQYILKKAGAEEQIPL